MKDEGFDIELSKLGERIRKIRKDRGLTQVDLHLSTGIHDSDLSRLERGIDNIEFLTIYKIAQALSLTTKELLDYDAPLPIYGKPKRSPKSRARSTKDKKK